MSVNELIGGGALSLAVILTLIQITPIKVNPWSAITRALGKMLNADMMDKLDKQAADTARYRIIRFDDEVRHKEKHSEEHFNQIIDDIDDYERYCDTHPDYKNNKAMSAIENIKRIYQRCKDENSFLI